MAEITIRSLNNKNDYYMNEAYKALRTNIEFAGEDKKAFVVTSCMPNEGKSTTTMNLAVSLTEAGKNVCFVDADLRKSVLAGRYHVKGSYKGVTHYLTGKAELTECIFNTNINRLDMILSGQVPPNPSELLGSKRFSYLIQTLRDHYDYVIVDAPPVGSVIDAVVISRATDASIIVCASGEVSYRFLQDVQNQLEMAGSDILGVVLDKVPISSGNKYYGKYYGHYYGKYYGTNGQSED